MERDRDDGIGVPSGGDGTVVRATEPGSVPIGAEEVSSSLGEGPVITAEGGGDGGAAVTPMDSTQTVEGFVITTTGVGDALAAGDTMMDECRTVEGESRTVEVSTGGNDTIMGEHRAVEEEHRMVEEPTEGSSMGLFMSMPATPASTPFTSAGSVIEMEI
ncbi:hypothetical protein RHSIM_Rhsim05G0118700 [Rhododendron simsii]|uniref:Uncharacterized protein n=1 Tax=Rhododendron simsii TaxID=118357 RepID=A0A834LPB0_RHOSS|nr:hypothetical protein RHSIM_Rhsim05G0118700 [Rhododendron simsii]